MMRLFKRKHESLRAGWLLDHGERLYRERGRWRVTVIGSGASWIYRVSDRDGEIQPKDSQPFPSQEAALEAASDDLQQSPVEKRSVVEY
jgi:hypothetical protein